MKLKVLLFTICILLAGCAPSIFINKEYSQTNFQDQKINVAIIDTVSFNYEGNMDNEFPASKDHEFPIINRSEKVKIFIEKAIAKALKDSSVFKTVNIAKPYCDSFMDANLQWKDTTTFKVSIPSSECLLPADSNALWLFVEQPKVESKAWVQIIMVYMVPVGAIPHKPLKITSRFVYWDAIQKKPIAWGNASGVYDDGPAVTIKNWQEASKAHGLSMIKKSPFERNKKIENK